MGAVGRVVPRGENLTRLEQREGVARLFGRLADELLREEPEPVLAGTAAPSCAGGR